MNNSCKICSCFIQFTYIYIFDEYTCFSFRFSLSREVSSSQYFADVTLQVQIHLSQRHTKASNIYYTYCDRDFSLDNLLSDILDAHEAQFERHQVKLNVLLPDQPVSTLAVKGMVVQVVENLISNSVYWMDVEKQRKISFKLFGNMLNRFRVMITC